jgi:hypothetical protein
VLQHAPPRPVETAPLAADADAHQSGDDARHGDELHCRVVVAPADADAHQSGDGVRHLGELHCRVVVAPADADAHQSGDGVRHLGELHCRVVVHPQDALHPLESRDQSKAARVERSEIPDAYLGVADDRPELQCYHLDQADAPDEHSEFRDGRQVCQDAPDEHSEFQDDRQACQDAPDEHSEFRDDRQAYQDAPASRAVQGDRRPGGPVSRVPVACRPVAAAASKWEAADATLAE